jgi:hypothetical protein
MNYMFSVNDKCFKSINEIKKEKECNKLVNKLTEQILLKSEKNDNFDNNITIICVKNKKESCDNLCKMLEKMDKKTVIFLIGKNVKRITGFRKIKGMLLLTLYFYLLDNYEEETMKINDVKNYIESNYSFLKKYKKEYLEI